MNTSFLHKLANYVLSNRSGIMGVAIIWVFLLHSAIGQNLLGGSNYLLDHGWVGVDIFIFLSSLGLCFSYSKNSLKTFYYRRLVRIIPTWLLVLFVIHIIGLVVSPLYPNLNFNYPKTLPEMLCWYTGVGYWLDGCCYEWYVPTLLLFYIIFPVFYKLSNRNLWIILLLGTIVAMYMYYNELFFHARFSYTRLIVFILGILFYRYLKTGMLHKFFIPISVSVLLMFLIYNFINISDVFIYGYLTPILVLLIAWGLQVFKLSNVFSFWGTLSLEFYLIHLYRRPQFFVGLFTDSEILQHLIAFLLCTLLSFILNKIMSNLNQYLINVVKK